MDSLTVTALLMAGLGVFIIAFLGAILWQALLLGFSKNLRGLYLQIIGSFGTNKSSQNYDAIENKLNSVFEEYLPNSSRAEVRTVLLSAFENPKKEFPFHDLDRIYQLHLGVLARLLTAAEKRKISLQQLPVLEDLVHHRNVLLSTHREIRLSMQNISVKRQSKGKEFSGWARNDYEERLKAAFQDVEVNRLSIISKLDEIIDQLIQEDSRPEVTYH